MPRLGHDRDTDQVEDAQHDGDRVPNRGLEGHGDIPYGDQRPLASEGKGLLFCNQDYRWFSASKTAESPLQIPPDAPHNTHLYETDRPIRTSTDPVVRLTAL